jgi:putative acetyltransferase
MIEIKQIQPHQTEEVKRIILKKGTFLVVMDDEAVVGCGGIKNLNSETCELKRMWLLKSHRGQGLGFQLAQMLLDFATQTGYKIIRLDVFDPNKQRGAIAFYQKLGFYSIDRYNDSPCQIFMEKILS